MAETDTIAEVGIDELGRLYVAPTDCEFPYIYREAMEVHWDATRRYLYAPAPPRAQLAPPLWWFQRILAAALEQSCELRLRPDTRWCNLPAELQSEVQAALSTDA